MILITVLSYIVKELSHMVQCTKIFLIRWYYLKYCVTPCWSVARFLSPCVHAFRKCDVPAGDSMSCQWYARLSRPCHCGPSWLVNTYTLKGGVSCWIPHSLLSPRWVNTSSSCWRQTRTPPSRTPALLGLGWIPPDLGAFNLGLIAPVTAQTLGYRSAWSPGTALSHLGSASLVAQGLYSDIGLQNVGTNGLSFVLGRLSYRTSIYTCRYT